MKAVDGAKRIPYSDKESHLEEEKKKKEINISGCSFGSHNNATVSRAVPPGSLNRHAYLVKGSFVLFLFLSFFEKTAFASCILFLYYPIGLEYYAHKGIHFSHMKCKQIRVSECLIILLKRSVQNGA